MIRAASLDDLIASDSWRHLRHGAVTGSTAARAQIGVKPRFRPRHGFVTAPRHVSRRL